MPTTTLGAEECDLIYQLRTVNIIYQLRTVNIIYQLRTVNIIYQLRTVNMGVVNNTHTSHPKSARQSIT